MMLERRLKRRILDDSSSGSGSSSSEETTINNNKTNNKQNPTTPKKKVPNNHNEMTTPVSKTATGRKEKEEDELQNSRESLVSNPGSPDFSQTQRPLDQSPKPSTMEMTVEEDNDYDEDDYEENDDVSIYSAPADAEAFYGDETDNNGFIQPEGNAEQLPGDIVDQTRNLDFTELGPFYDDHMTFLEKELIPQRKLKVLMFERDWKNHNYDDDLLLEFDNKVLSLRDEIVKSLVQEELDQCRFALKKLRSRRHYQRYKESLPSNQPPMKRNLEIREFRFDSIAESVHELVVRLNRILEAVEEKQFDNHVIPRGDEDDASNHYSSDGYADPMDSQIPQGVFQELDDNRRNKNSESPLDLHPYASKKRKRREGELWTEKGNKDKSRKRHGRRNSRKKKGKLQQDDTVHISTEEGQGQNKPIHDSRGDANGRKKSKKVKKRNHKAGNQQARKGDKNVHDEESGEMGLGPTEEHDEDYPDSPQPLEFSPGYDRHFTERSGSREAPAYGRRNLSCSSNNNNVLEGIFDAPATTRLNVGHQRNQESVVHRMERFLEANGNATFNFDDVEQNSGRALQSNHRRTQTNSFENETEQNNATQPTGHLREKLFSALLNKNNAESQEERWVSATKSVSDLCDQLLRDFPLGNSKRSIKEILNQVLNSEHACQLYASTVFGSFLQSLEKYGCRTLQDMVSSRDSALSAHVSLLAGLLKLLEKNANKYLQSDSGKPITVFSPDKVEVFKKVLLVQMVDSTMSLTNPAAWALQIANPEKILKELAPLRDAFGAHFMVVERVSRCLLKELGCQKWRCVRNGEHAFVSSVDPTEWAEFLTTGVESSNNLQIRQDALTKKIPRCDIDAVWSILAYFGQARHQSNELETSRWNLALKLFSESALSKSTLVLKLPPSKEQMKSAEVDVGNFISLLQSGNMGNLPKQDTMLVELLKRTIFLQGFEILHNKNARETFFPSIGDKKVAKQCLSNLWQEENITLDPAQISTSSLIQALCQTKMGSTWTNQPLCCPASFILRQSLGLLLAWTDLIPDESGARSRRFNMNLKSLIDTLFKEGKRIINNSSKSQAENSDDLFTAAFASGTGASKSGQAETRQGLFLLESAAYLSICASIGNDLKHLGETRNHSLNDYSKVCRNLWEQMSDEVMKGRQESIKFMENQISITYKLDSLRLHVTSKVLTCLFLFYLGVSPWEGDLASNRLSLHQLMHTIEIDAELISFLLYGILSCLDCACDSVHNVEIIASIAAGLVITLKSICRILPTLVAAKAKELASLITQHSFHEKTVLIFQKGFRVIANASFCGLEEELCLRTLLSLLRWTLIFQRKSVGITASSSADIQGTNSVTTGNDDMFGGFDDDFLANLDLEAITGCSSQTERRKETPKIFGFLDEILQEALPSVRFNIPDANTTLMSSQGRTLAAKLYKLISGCMSELVRSEFCPPIDSIRLLNPSKPYAFEKNREDKRFESKVRYIFSQELCRMVACPKIRELIRSKSDSILGTMIERLLDVNLIRSFPSCNLERIKAHAGEEGEAKAFKCLRAFADCKINSVWRKMIELRAYCNNVGMILMSSEGQMDREENWLSAWNVDSDLRIAWSNNLRLSLEKECFDRFRLFRTILSVSASEDTPFKFESVATTILSCGSSNLLQLLDLYQLQRRAQQGIDNTTYEVAQLFETYSSYVDLFICMMAWIFRESKTVASNTFESYLQGIWNNFLSPLLCSPSFNLYAKLGQLVKHSNMVCFSQDDESSESFDCIEFCKTMQYCLIRRIRSFLIFSIPCEASSSNNDTNRILNDVVSCGLSGKEDIAKIISYSFIPQSHFDELRPTSPCSVLLQREFSEYIVEVDDGLKLSSDQAKAFFDLKEKAYSLIPISYLHSSKNNPERRLAIISFLGHMLDSEHENVAANIGSSNLPLSRLCAIGKGVAAFLKDCLASNVVDETCVQSVFSCAWSLLNLPASSVTSYEIGFLVDLCCKLSSPGVLGCNEVDVIAAKYIWNISKWLKELGNLIFNSASENIDSIRIKFKDLSGSDRLPWEADVPYISAKVLDELALLEELVFPKPAGKCGIQNIYATQRPPNEGPFTSWIPHRLTRHCIIKFASKVSTASCYS